MGVAATKWVLMRAQVPVLSPNDHPNPSQEKSQIFENFQVPLDSLNKQQQFQGVRGGHCLGYMGLVGTQWVPWVLKYPYCQQMITQAHPTGDQWVSEKGKISKVFKCH